MAITTLPNRRQIATAFRLLGSITPFFRRHWARLTLGFASLIVVDLLQLLIPRITKKAFDGLHQATASHGDLGRWALLIVALALTTALLRFCWRHAILGFSRILEKDIRTGLLRHLLGMDIFFFQKNSPGSIMALASNDLMAVQMACGLGLVSATDALFMSTATIGFMLAINPFLTLLAIMPMPLLIVATTMLSTRLHRRFKRVQEQFSRLTEFARTSLATIRLIKAYTQEKEQADRFETMGKVYVDDNVRLAVIHGILWPFSGLIANVCLLIIVFVGGRLTIAGTISIGGFVAFMSYLYMLTWPMMAIGWVANLFQRGATSLSRINEVMEKSSLFAAPAAPRVLTKPLRSISMRGLTFSYPHKDPADRAGAIPDARDTSSVRSVVLKEIDVSFGPGITGIVGRTGSGKSTLCRLMARLYPVPAGTLFYDGIDACDLDLAAVRRQIAYVPQDIVLFSGTIGENIAIGRTDATQAEIESVAQAASLHDEITAMAQGYGTRIGERGVQLSGGQRQRLALARALIATRPVLIIDDSLSAVDAQTEHNIIQGLAPYLRDRTCIIVSHRIAPLAGAARIIVMEAGRIEASGTHQELVIENDYYRSIHQHQTEAGILPPVGAGSL